MFVVKKSVNMTYFNKIISQYGASKKISWDCEIRNENNLKKILAFSIASNPEICNFYLM